MFKSIYCLDLPMKVKQTLIRCGLSFTNDFCNFSILQLKAVTHLTEEECANILNQNRSNNSSLKAIDAFTLLQEELCKSSIFSFCRELNSILEDGFPTGRVIELFGEAGVGKTQICLQLCVNVQIPETCGGPGGEALFIDTENCFRSGRLKEIAQGAVDLLCLEEKEFSVEKVMEGCHVIRIKEKFELKLLIVKKLEQFLSSKPKIRLIVLDSIAYFFKYEETNLRGRNTDLLMIIHRLKTIAFSFQVCIVITNHVSCIIDQGITTSALGKQWEHMSFIRMHLAKVNNRRSIELIKSPNFPKKTVFYRIVKNGIADISEDEHIKQLI